MTNILLQHRRLLVILSHVLIAGLCYYFGFLLRFDGKIPPREFGIFLTTLPLAVLFKFLSLLYFRLHQGLWRYASLDDLLLLLKACTLSTTAFIIAVIFTYGHGFPRSVFVIDWILSLLAFGGIRLSYRVFKELTPKHDRKNTPGRRTLIIGAGNDGETALRDLRRSSGHTHKVVGFLDDDLLKHGMTIHGVPVLGTTKDAVAIMKAEEIQEVLFAIPSLSKHYIREIVQQCGGQNIRFRLLPSVRDIVSGKVEVQHVRNVEVEDLLGREPIQLNRDRVFHNVRGKSVLITGAGGSIGSELARQVASYEPSRLVLFDLAETALFEIDNELAAQYPRLSRKIVLGDITNQDHVESAFQKYAPAIIYHAAAYKHVPLMEAHPIRAVHNNTFGTKLVAETAIKYDAEQFLLISTDKAVHPKSVMGATKRCAEMVLATAATYSTKMLTVRFGNVLGSSGSVIPLFRRQIAAGGPVTITHPDATRYFLTIPEAVELVLQAGAIGKGGEIFLLEMGDPIRIVDLAKNMIELSGLTVGEDIKIEYIGLRPGEKLHEELVIDGETVDHTVVPKVLVHKPQAIDRALFTQKLIALEKAARNNDEETTLDDLMDIIMTFDNHHDIDLRTPNEHPTPFPPPLRIVNG